jgi:hypothetical protein
VWWSSRRFENIIYESTAGRGETARMARVVMAYTFADVDSGEGITAKVAGQGLGAGDLQGNDRGVEVRMLKSFLLATGWS